MLENRSGSQKYLPHHATMLLLSLSCTFFKHFYPVHRKLTCFSICVRNTLFPIFHMLLRTAFFHFILTSDPGKLFHLNLHRLCYIWDKCHTNKNCPISLYPPPPKKQKKGGTLWGVIEAIGKPPLFGTQLALQHGCANKLKTHMTQDSKQTKRKIKQWN